MILAWLSSPRVAVGVDPECLLDQASVDNWMARAPPASPFHPAVDVLPRKDSALGATR